LQLGLREPQIRIGQHRLRIDVEAYGTRQQPRILGCAEWSAGISI
jgi:hypothetical protein